MIDPASSSQIKEVQHDDQNQRQFGCHFPLGKTMARLALSVAETPTVATSASSRGGLPKSLFPTLLAKGWRSAGLSFLNSTKIAYLQPDNPAAK